MFKIFGFGRAKPAADQSVRPAHDQAATTRQHTDIQRELVRVVLRDTLRLHGIPGAWLGCEVTALSGRARGEDILVRLVVLTWNEALLKYLPVLQQQLIVGLDRFEPSIDHSKYVVSWQFAPDCGCPHTQMPDAKTWGGDGAPAATPSIVDWEPHGKGATSATAPAAAAAKPKFDLPVSALDRSASATGTFAATEPSPLSPTPKPKFDLPTSEKDAMPSNFAPTEPGPLRKS
jgi:hypothetical protein